MKKQYILSTLALSLMSFNVSAVNFVVQGIKVEGVTEAQQQSLIKRSGIIPGKRVTDADISRAIKKLFATGNFKNISIKQDGNNLVIKVDLVSTIANVTVKGNKLIPSDQLTKTYAQNGVAQGSKLNQGLIDSINKEIITYYKTQGYENVTISTDLQTQDDNTVYVLININENSQLKLTKLQILGNENFTASQIIADARLKPNSFLLNPFTTSRLTQANQAELSKDITDFYLNHGYAEVKINNMSLEILKDNKAQLKVVLTEGKKYNYGNVNVISNNSSLVTELASYTSLPKGKVFNGAQVNAHIAAITNRLGELGYYNSRVNSVVKANKTNPDQIDVTFAVETGKKYLVRRIEFEGNEITQDDVLRREVKQSENSVLNSNLLDSGKNNLNRVGYFGQVDYEIKPVTGTVDQVDVVYKVTERNTGSANAGFGVGSGTGLSAQFTVKQDNFLGTGNQAGISLNKSKSSTQFGVNYLNPYFTKNGVSLGGSVNLSLLDTSKLRSGLSDYRVRSFGAEINSGFPLSDSTRLYGSISLNNYQIDRLSPEYYRKLYLDSIKSTTTKTNKWTIRYKDIGLSAGVVYSTLNRGYFPTKGLYVNTGVSYVGIASTNNYLSSNFTLSNYLPLDNDHGFVLVTKFNYNNLHSLSSKRTPPGNLLSAGAQDSIRGFGYGAIGPSAIYQSKAYENKLSSYDSVSNDVIGGDNMSTATFELVLPIFKGTTSESLRASVFYDVASVWSSTFRADTKALPEKTRKALLAQGDYSQVFGNKRSSVGVSLQWISPIGPLSFSYAVPLVKKNNDFIEKFQFNIGTTF